MSKKKVVRIFAGKCRNLFGGPCTETKFVKWEMTKKGRQMSKFVKWSSSRKRLRTAVLH